MEDSVLFKDSLGTTLRGTLNEVSRHVVILLHGFRDSQNGGTVKRLAHDLIEQNVSTFRFDMYAHGESDGEFEKLTITRASLGVISAIDMLKEMGFEKIGIVGVSFGGTVALVTANKKSEVKYLALKSPVSDYGYIEQKRKGTAKVLEDGSFEITTRSKNTYRLNKEFYQNGLVNCSYNFASQLKIPVFIVHGDADSVVPVEQSIKLASMIRNSNIVVLAGCDHWFNAEYFEQAINLIEEFVIIQK
jgi:uncharacterized protein